MIDEIDAAVGVHGGRREIAAQSLQPSAAGPQGTPTEVLKSAAVIDFSQFSGGVSNVQNFDPGLVQGEEGITTIRQLISGYFGLGGMSATLPLGVPCLTHAAINSISSPERLRSLLK